MDHGIELLISLDIKTCCRSSLLTLELHNILTVFTFINLLNANLYIRSCHTPTDYSFNCKPDDLNTIHGYGQSM